MQTSRLVGGLLLMGALAALLEACRERGEQPDPLAPAAAVAESVAAPEIPPWSPPEVTEYERELWYEVSAMGTKAGWNSVKIAETTWHGAPAIYYESHMMLQVTALGASLTQEVMQQVVFDPSGRPLRGHYEFRGPQSQTVDALFEDDMVVYERVAAGSSRRGTIRLEPGTDLSDPEIATLRAVPKAGDSRDLYVFEPTSLRIMEASYVVEGEEAIELAGEQRRCVKVVTTLRPTGTLTTWVDTSTGEPVRTVTPSASLEMTLTDEATAKAMPTGYRPDLAVQTRIAVDRPIENPGRVLDLRLRVSRIPASDVLIDDGRQRWSEVSRENDGTYEATVTVSVPPAPSTGSRLPVDGPSEFLRPSAHIESDDPDVVRQAREIVGEGADSAEAALAIARWVNANVRPDASIGMVRSAKEVLAQPRGVCRDYAALYAGLARAVGIPTKFAAGCVYWDLGGASGFYYHAWNEVCLDGRTWTAVDSTRPQSWPVDATHLKFAEGEVDSMVDVVGLIGALRIEVIGQGNGGAPAAE